MKVADELADRLREPILKALAKENVLGMVVDEEQLDEDGWLTSVIYCRVWSEDESLTNDRAHVEQEINVFVKIKRGL